MEESHFDRLFQSVYSPESAFRLYLCPKDFNPLELSDFNGYEVPNIFSEAFVHFLFKIEKKSGYAKLQIRTEVIKQGKKVRVKWESGTSELGYLDESDMKVLNQLSRRYLREKMEQYRLGHKDS